MKKKIALLMLFVMMFTLFSSFAKKNTDWQDIGTIKKTVEKYFKTSSDILVTQNKKDLLKLQKMFYKAKDNDSYKYERSRIKYLIASCKHAEAEYISITNSYVYNSIDVNNDTILVDVDVKQDILLSTVGRSEDLLTNHVLTLKVTSRGLYIIDDEYCSGLTDIFPTTESFEKAEKEFADGTYDKIMSEKKYESYLSEEEDVCSPNALKAEALSSDSSGPLRRPVGEYTITYDRRKAVDYANTWVKDETGHDGSSYNSKQFKYFREKNDCQNYVSQCIWAGFGGTDSRPVSGTSYPPLPMTDVWWATNDSTSTTWIWTQVDYFYNYITNNLKYNRYGPRGEVVPITAVREGDYAYLSGQHVALVVETDGTWSGTYFNAHTSNHRRRLAPIVFAPSEIANIKFVHVRDFLWCE